MKAIIFDFDGLILDTELPEVEAWRKVFAHHGCTFPDEWWMNAIGRGADQILETPYDLLLRQLGEPIAEEEIQEMRRGIFWELMHEQDALPGVRELISEAQGENIPLAVASSSRHDWVDTFLIKLGLIEAFTAIVCREDVARAKPHPDLYIAACEALSIPASDAIAIEDSPTGARAAVDAGLFCVVVPNELTRQMDTSHAHARLDSLAAASLNILRGLHGSWRTDL